MLAYFLFFLSCGNSEEKERLEGSEPGDCTDLADNDMDGNFDCDDDGCTNSPECVETVDPTTEPTTEPSEEPSNEYFENKVPTVEIVSHNDDSEFFEGYSVEFRAVLFDENHENSELVARWMINGAEECSFQQPDQSGHSICVVTIDTGDEEVIVEVRDPEGASSSDTINLTVVPSVAPTAEILQPIDSGVYYSNEPITFEGKIGDAEDDVSELVYEWSSNIDGVIDVNAAVESDGSMFGSAYLSEGNHYLTLRVEDTTGKTSTAGMNVTVGGPNNPPTCEITSPSTDTIGTIGETISFSGIVNDIDIPEEWLLVSWHSQTDGEIGTSYPSNSGDVAFLFSGLSVNEHIISMKVEDEKGAECTSSIVYTVTNPTR